MVVDDYAERGVSMVGRVSPAKRVDRTLAPDPEWASTKGLTFAGLDPEFKAENRASWN